MFVQEKVWSRLHEESRTGSNPARQRCIRKNPATRPQGTRLLPGGNLCRHSFPARAGGTMAADRRIGADAWIPAFSSWQAKGPHIKNGGKPGRAARTSGWRGFPGRMTSRRMCAPVTRMVSRDAAGGALFGYVFYDAACRRATGRAAAEKWTCSGRVNRPARMAVYRDSIE